MSNEQAAAAVAATTTTTAATTATAATTTASSSKSTTSTSSAAPAASSSTVTSASTGEQFTSASTFSSLGDFQKRFPEMYNKFMKNVADCVITDMKKGSDRVKAALKKMRES